MAIIHTREHRRTAPRASSATTRLDGTSSHRVALLGLAALLLLGLALRAYCLPARSLWFDEAFTWQLIQFPWLEMLERAASDNNPPLYYILLKAWTAVLGTSEVALRMPSVLFGGITIVGMYLFTAKAFERSGSSGQRVGAGRQEVGLVVAALVALNVFQIRWAWEARMYTLGTALTAFSSWALFCALRNRASSLRWWLCYALFTLLLAYTHYYALFCIVAQAVFLAVYLLNCSHWKLTAVIRDKRLCHASLAGLIVFVGFLPWLPAFLRGWTQVRGNFWISPLTWDTVPKLAYTMFIDPQDAVLSPGNIAAAISLAGIVLVTGWGIIRSESAWTGRIPAIGYIGTAALLPLGASAVACLFGTQIFEGRYFLFAHLFFLAGLGVLLTLNSSPLVRGLRYTVVLGIFLFLDVQFWFKMDLADKPGARAAATWLSEHRQPEEPVLVSATVLYLPMRYHVADRTDLFAYGDWNDLRHYSGTAVLSPADLRDLEWLRTLRTRRLWIVNISQGSWAIPVTEVPVSNSWVVKNRRVFPEAYRFQGSVVVVEYQRADLLEAGE